MYLSRLMLNSHSRRVQRDLADPYQMHLTVMRAFPAVQDGGPGRVLFRVDVTRDGGRLLLVQSDKRPDWRWLDDAEWRGYVLPAAGSVASKEWQPALQRGQALAFCLRANPTMKRKGERLGLMKLAEQEAWLQRKMEAAGARVVRVDVRPEGMVHGFGRDDEGKAQHMSLFAVRMEGVLRVLEPVQLEQAVSGGIGSAKGFGFGLLSLAPVT